MRRRQFLITAVALGAIAIIGLGMALTASARQDVLSKVAQRDGPVQLDRAGQEGGLRGLLRLHGTAGQGHHGPAPTSIASSWSATRR